MIERHLDLFRLILVEVEEIGDPMLGLRGNPQIAGFTGGQVGYHLRLLVEDGYLQAKDVTAMKASSPQYVAIQLTNKGHDFVSATANGKVYAATKSILSTAGAWTLELAKQVAQQQLKQMLGLPPG